MPIPSYSVLKGRPTAEKIVSGASAHDQITVQATGGVHGTFTVAVNIQSVDGSEVLYAIRKQFTPPNPAGLTGLPTGVTALKNVAGGLALDFVRETIAGQPMITRAEMTLLPIATNSARFVAESAAKTMPHEDRAAHALQDAVSQLVEQAIADPGATIYAFGSAFSDAGVVDGIHDIHMNQGNPVSNHGNENGTWQDGAVFFYRPSQSAWTALFLAFQTESWKTDAKGNPA